ncbi:MAG TPA: DUF1028 domain-containing protein [Solirubrobacteraceae bacterium]|jgi:uncharacterized Ntn-hydrolase superfamily protein
MTYTVLAQCPTSGAIGIGVTTASVNCGRVVPHVKGLLPTLQENGAMIASQSMCNPMLSFKAFELLDRGASFDEIEGAFEQEDEYLAHRQVGIVTVSGKAWAYTGDKCFSNKSHMVGDGYVVMGNALSADCVPAMVEAFEANTGVELGERLLRTLEAGRAAGGQEWEGQSIPEFSCGLHVYDGKNPYPAVDLRVDFDPSAVTKMRRLVDNLRADGDTYFDTFYRRPHEFNDDTMGWAFDLAGKQI